MVTLASHVSLPLSLNPAVVDFYPLLSGSQVITLGTRLDCGQAFGISLVLAVLLLVINFAAILFIDKSLWWVKFHQRRAGKILETYAPGLIEKVVKAEEKPDSLKDPLSLINIQKYLHAIFSVIALIYPAVIYFICANP